MCDRTSTEVTGEDNVVNMSVRVIIETDLLVRGYVTPHYCQLHVILRLRRLHAAFSHCPVVPMTVSLLRANMDSSTHHTHVEASYDHKRSALCSCLVSIVLITTQCRVIHA